MEQEPSDNNKSSKLDSNINNNESDLGPIGFTLQSNVPTDDSEEQQTEASLEEGNATTTEN